MDQECWICLGDDDDAPAKKWVQACKCSLVAHEHCLLVWIASKQEHTSVVKCPQCREAYRVEEAQNLLYQALDIGDRISHRVCIWSYELAFPFATRIGFQTLKGILGPQMRLLLGGAGREGWPNWAEWGLPFLPVVMICTSLGPDLLHEPDVFAELFTFSVGAVVLPMFILPTLRGSNPFGYRPALPGGLGLFRGRGLYPPGPGLTLLLLPFAKYAYTLGRRRVFDAYLGPLAPQIRAGQPEPVLVDEPPVVEHGPLGGLAAQAIAVFRPPPPPPPPPHPLDEADPQPLLQDPDAVVPERFFLLRDTAKRRVGAAILMPYLASYASSGLLWLSKHSGALQYVLGASVSAVGVTRLGQGPGRVKVAFARDAVWWRTILGGFMVLLAKDSLTLLHHTLKIKQVRTRRVVEMRR